MESKPVVISEIGSGINLDQSGVLRLDVGARYKWTGSHTFAQPVTFSFGQKISTGYLSSKDAKTGGVLTYDGKTWRCSNPSEQGLVLISSGGMAAWSHVDLKYCVGVVEPSHGGFGEQIFSAGDLMYAASDKAFKTLSIGPKHFVLRSDGEKPYWGESGDLYGLGKLNYIAIFEGDKHVASSTAKLVDGHLSIFGDVASISLVSKYATGSISIIKDDAIQITQGESIIELSKNSILLSCESSSVLIKDGEINGARISAENVHGIVTVEHGGTGCGIFESNAIVIATSPNQLASFSTRDAEGKVLGVVNGKLAWVNPSHDMRYTAPRSSDPRCLVPISDGRYASVEGCLERLNGELHYIDSIQMRRKLVLEGSDFNGLAQNVKGIVSMANGGTNNNLSNLNPGHLIVSGNGRLEAVIQGAKGLALVSNGYDQAPVWSPMIRSIVAKSGATISTNQFGDAVFSLNLEEILDYFVRKGMSKGMRSDDSITVTPKSGVHFKLSSSKGPTSAQDGDVWFDGDDLLIRKKGQIQVIGGKTEVPPQVIHLQILRGVSPLDCYIYPYLVPYDADGVTAVSWVVKRIDLMCGIPSHDGEARAIILCNTTPMVDPFIAVARGEQTGAKTEFTHTVVRSGDVIRVGRMQDGGSDAWSVFMTLVKL